MASLFKTTLNTRYLPTGDNRFIRSDCPLNISDEEIAFLRENNFLTIVDLRSEKEYTAKPCRLENDKDFNYLHMPVTGGMMPESPEQVVPGYLEMLDAQMDKIVDTITTAPSKVMFFCSAGKDRSGMVSLMILRKLGIDEQTIIDDYMASKDNLMDLLVKLANQYKDLFLETMVPDVKNVKKVLEELNNR